MTPMYRRIELINPPRVEDEISIPAHKTGLMGAGPNELWEAWVDDLVGPDRSLPQNCRFYFTEKGWREVGRNVVAVARRIAMVVIHCGAHHRSGLDAGQAIVEDLLQFSASVFKCALIAGKIAGQKLGQCRLVTLEAEHQRNGQFSDKLIQ